MNKKYRITFKEDKLDPIIITIKGKDGNYHLTSPINAKEVNFNPPQIAFETETSVLDWIENKLYKYEIKEIKALHD